MPPTGPERLRWFHEVRRALAADQARTVARLGEEGWRDDEAAGVADVALSWLVAALEVDTAEAAVLGRWATP